MTTPISCSKRLPVWPTARRKDSPRQRRPPTRPGETRTGGGLLDRLPIPVLGFEPDDQLEPPFTPGPPPETRPPELKVPLPLAAEPVPVPPP